MRHSGIV